MVGIQMGNNMVVAVQKQTIVEGKWDLPFRNACGVLNGGCSAWLQVESTKMWTTLPVWAMFSGSA